MYVIINGRAVRLNPDVLEEIERLHKKYLRVADETGKIIMRNVRKEVLMLKLFGVNGRKRRR